MKAIHSQVVGEGKAFEDFKLKKMKSDLDYKMYMKEYVDDCDEYF